MVRMSSGFFINSYIMDEFIISRAVSLFIPGIAGIPGMAGREAGQWPRRQGLLAGRRTPIGRTWLS